MKQLFSLFIVSLFLVANSSAQWQAYGPKGGNMNCFIKAGGYYFSSSSVWINGGIYVGGLYYSSDALNWQPIRIPWSVSRPLTTIHYVWNFLYAGSDSGLFRTSNLGATWSSVTNGLTGKSIMSIGNDESHLYVSTSDSGFFRSDDQGGSWVKRNTNLPSMNLGNLCVIENKMWVATSAAEVRMSSNFGDNWIYTNQLRFSSMAKDDSFYYQARESFIQRSSDGLSWGIRLLDTYNTRSLAWLAPYLYAGTQAGLFWSTNRGFNWTRDSMFAYTKLIIDPPYLYAATEGEGIFRSALAPNISWSERNNGIHNTFVSSVLKKDNFLFAAASSGLFRSTDNGVTWSRMYSRGNIACLFHNQGRIFAGVSTTSPSPLFYSNDNGTTWNNADSSLTSRYVLGMIKFNDKIFACSEAGVYVSADNGDHWQRRSTGYFVSITANNAYLFTADLYNKGYKSTDEGISWAQCYTATNTINAICADTLNVYTCNWRAGIQVSTNNGTSWTGLNNGLPPNANVKSLFLKRPIIVAALFQGVYLSSDYGSSWRPFNDNTAVPVNQILADSTNLYAASNGYGVLFRPLSEITAVEVDRNTVVKDFGLFQNYPNPFNPMTEIRYQTPEISHVTLKVFDILGREVATLVNEQASPGTYTTRWDASGVASGVYLYRMQAGTFVTTKKMLSIR
jgi:photosystem II stability/assembly factor-like uncharacterized protein